MPSPKLTKKIVEQLEKTECRVLLRYWYELPNDTVLAIRTTDDLCSALLEDPMKFANGPLDAEGLILLGDESLVSWLDQIQKYLRGEIKQAPLRAVLATATVLNADSAVEAPTPVEQEKKPMVVKLKSGGLRKAAAEESVFTPPVPVNEKPEGEESPDVTLILNAVEEGMQAMQEATLQPMLDKLAGIEEGLLALINTQLEDGEPPYETYEQLLEDLRAPADQIPE